VNTNAGHIQKIRARKLLHPKKKRALKPLKPRFPHTAERDYMRYLKKYVSRAKELTERIVKPLLPALIREARPALPSSARKDDAIDDLSSALARVKELLNQEFTDTDLYNIALAMGLSIETVIRANAQVHAEQVYGNIVGRVAFPPSYTDLLKLKAKENVQLIKTLPERHFAALQSSAELGARTDLSEAAIKNIFYSQSISLERLAQFCEAIGIGVGELCQSAGMGVGGDQELSEMNEEFFVKNSDYFQFFRELVLHRKAIRTIKREYGLNDKSIRAYCAQPEKMGLIETHGAIGVRFLFKGRFRWRKRGPWFKRKYISTINAQASKLAGQIGTDLEFISHGGFSLSRKHLLRFYGEIESTIDEYKALSYSNLIARSETDRRSEIFVGWNFLISPDSHSGEGAGISNLP